MGIYLSGTEKGGVGKTTIALNWACALATVGRDVLLLDTDPSRDASNWAALRVEKCPTLPRVHCHQAFGPAVVSDVRDGAARYQDVVIDAGGRDSQELRAAMTVAQTMVLPLQASQFDVWQLDKMSELVHQARGFNPELQVFAVLNRASTNHVVTAADEAAEVIAQHPELRLAAARLRDRKPVADAVSEGRAVIESEDRKARKAAAEFMALFHEVTADGTFPQTEAA